MDPILTAEAYRLRGRRGLEGWGKLSQRIAIEVWGVSTLLLKHPKPQAEQVLQGSYHLCPLKMDTKKSKIIDK